MRCLSVLSLTVVGLLVVSCSGGSHPAASATPSATFAPLTTAARASSASATPSPTATTPLLTGAAVEPGEVPPTLDRTLAVHTSGGALVFTGYFYRALDWSLATTNPDLLRPISAATCGPCQKYITDIDAVAAAGGHSEGGRIAATSFDVGHSKDMPSEYTVKVTVAQLAEVIVSSDGARTSYAAVPAKADYLFLNWVNGGWIAVGIER